jgi:hypothetical protein
MLENDDKAENNSKLETNRKTGEQFYSWRKIVKLENSMQAVVQQ